MPINDPPVNKSRPEHVGSKFIEIPEQDPVNHPSHYTGFSNGAEAIDIIESLTYNRGAAVKYLARAGRKRGADELEDLRKAQWYVNREIERVIRVFNLIEQETVVAMKKAVR